MSHFASGDRLKKCFHVIQLFFKSFLCGDFRHIRMMISVVADDVTFRYHAFGKFRTGFQKISDDKESANRLMVFQGIQNSRQIAVFISGIKGTLDNLTSKVKFTADYSADGAESTQVSAYTTIMTTDFSTYDDEIPAGETKSAVLLFEIPDSVTEVSDIVLHVTRDDTTYEIKL